MSTTPVLECSAEALVGVALIRLSVGPTDGQLVQISTFAFTHGRAGGTQTIGGLR